MWHIVARLWPYLSNYRGRVALAGVALVVAAVATLAMPVAFRWLIDLGFVPVGDTMLPQGGLSINRVFIGLFLLAVLLALGTALRFYLVAWLGERVTADLRRDVFAQVLRQDPVFFETLKTGELLSRLSTDTTLIQTLIGTSISFGLRNTLLFVGALVMMVLTSPRLASIMVALLLMVVVPILLFGRRVRRLSRHSQERLADSSALAGETLNAIQVVQAFVRENMESERYARATENAFHSAIARNRSRALLTVLAIVLVFGAIVFVLWLGAHAVMDERMTAGLLMQFMLYAALVGGTTGVIAEVLGDLQRAAGATDRLMELLEARPRILGGTLSMLNAVPDCAAAADDSAAGDAIANTASAVPLRGARIDFDRVRFCYPSRPTEKAIDGLTFTVKAGETIALVGPSGAGKTTVLQLMLRFYDPLSGSILYNGHRLAQIDLGALREAVGLVAQESVVFSASARENIRYGDPHASDAAVRQAAITAEAHDFIVRLPNGYDTYLGERGVRLSGGQRQRLAIARALLKNPPLLLLDEATSSLDAESERKVQIALEHAMQGRTTIVIAHRLATVVNADRILVLQHGRLVESGTHRELSAMDGVYARMAAIQFGV